jgi:DNA repair and recombination protein RAD52
MSDDSVGDQHKANGSTTTNPFEDTRPRLSEYTAQEIATLQSRLDKQLGPEYISSRPGASGQKVHYLAAEKVINLANEVFGFNGWSSAIQNIQIDFVDENQSGKISLGLSVIVRVTLKDGTFHEDVGYGHIENCKGKAAAFEKAKKEGTTDALKRALRTFGNILGNCIYDKEFLAKVTRIKVAPVSPHAYVKLYEDTDNPSQNGTLKIYIVTMIMLR